MSGEVAQRTCLWCSRPFVGEKPFCSPSCASEWQLHRPAPTPDAIHRARQQYAAHGVVVYVVCPQCGGAGEGLRAEYHHTATCTWPLPPTPEPPSDHPEFEHLLQSVTLPALARRAEARRKTPAPPSAAGLSVEVIPPTPEQQIAEDIATLTGLAEIIEQDDANDKLSDDIILDIEDARRFRRVLARLTERGTEATS